MAVLTAIASILYTDLFEIPIVLFYKLDLSNLPVLLATFSMGPVAGTITLLLKALIGLTHSSSLGVGELADFLVGASMLWPAGLLYRRNHTRKGALIGMLTGTAVATVAAVFCNLWILIPFYGVAYHMPVEQIVEMGKSILPAIDSVEKFVTLITAPFNLLKWVAISALTYAIYKPLSPVLHGLSRRKAVREEARP